MLKKVDGKWALISKKTLRPLAYYRGEGKPSDEWVKKQEQRIQTFKSMNEVVSPDILPKSGAGQDGTKTLVQSYMRDTPGQTFKDWRKKRNK